MRRGRDLARGGRTKATPGRDTLTRSDVLDVRALVTVAEISTSARGISAEVEINLRRSRAGPGMRGQR